MKNIDLIFHQEIILFTGLYNTNLYYKINKNKLEVVCIKSNKYYHPDEKTGICVVKRKDESVESLIKRFKKKYSKSGISKELHDRMYFEKPSEKKKRKRMQSIRNLQREEEKIEENKVKLDKLKVKNLRLKFKGDINNDQRSKRQSGSYFDDEKKD